MVGSAVFLNSRGWLRVSGQDAAKLLQGLISNDVTKLERDRLLWAALLTPQGKYLFDFLLFRHGEDIILEAEAERVDELRRRLLMYRLRADVDIEIVGEAWSSLVWLDGDGAPELADAPDLLAARDTRHASLGWRVLGPSAAVEAWLRRSALDVASFARWDRMRIGLGLPDGTRDLVVQKSILLESNFVELHGLAFDKGCFVGQELTARTHWRGLIKKRLLPVRFETSDAAPSGSVVTTLAGAEVGEVRSGSGALALALLRLESIGEPLTAGGMALRVAPPIWFAMQPSNAPPPRAAGP